MHKAGGVMINGLPILLNDSREGGKWQVSMNAIEDATYWTLYIASRLLIHVYSIYKSHIDLHIDSNDA
jgi:hypothetical protein